VFYSYRTAGRKLLKFFMDIMPLVINDDSYIIFHFLHSREWLEVVRCNGDNAIAHATLRIEPNPT
jgi:hypothetical protein